jgi:glutathione synthase
MVRRGAVTVGPAVNEMGVYGIFLSDGRDVLHNEPAGHLLRTKVGFLALALLSCP